jgi:DNA-binding NtrC family response regulator/tetratricopeptide (TPR) repeat protein
MKLADRYRIDRRVGEGGGGGVFLVRDRLSDDAPMVLKRLHAHAQVGVAQWLVNEFQVLAQLDLPAVARVFDFGLAEPDAEDPGGPFFTREFVDGAPLDKALQGSTPTPERLVELFAAAAETLRHMHRLGVVHGDLKPANLVVPRASGRAPVVLIDFGLAHGALGAVERVRGGTLAFMPPERRDRLFAGESLPPDPRADLYALSLSLLVTLGVEGVDAAVPDEVARDPRLAALVEVARAGASLDPDKRFRTADDVIAALFRVVADAPKPAATPARVVLRPEGRESELGQLLDHIGRRLLRRQGGDCVVLIDGEEGSGRTTLLRELTWRAQLRGVQVLHLQGEPGEAPAERLRVGIEVLSGAPLDDVSPDGYVAHLRRAVENAPVLLVADDLDRSDPYVCELLRSVAYGFDNNEPFLVVASTASRSSVQKLSPQSVVELGPLDESAVASLCEQILGPVEPGVVAAVRARTGALPLAVNEMLRALAEAGAVTAADVARVEIPPRAQDVARRRAQSLDSGSRRAVASAQALGVAADSKTLVAMGVSPQDIEGARALGALTLRANQTLAPSNPSLAQAVIDALDDEQRAQLHRDAARVLAASHAPEAAVAWAFLRAGDARSALDHARAGAKALAESNLPSAAAALLRALRNNAPTVVAPGDTQREAELFSAAGDYPAAIEAASTVESSGASELVQSARWVLVHSLSQSGRLSDAKTVARRAIAEGVDDEGRARSQYELARVFFSEGDYAGCVAGCELALALTKTPSLRAKLSALAGMSDVYVGEVGKAIGRLESALALWTEQSEPRQEASTLAYLAIARDRAGESSLAKSLYERALERARAGGDVSQMASARLNLGSLLEQMGDLASALEHLSAAEKLARRAGAVRVLLGAQLHLASHMIKLGSYERALSLLEQALGEARTAGLRMLVAHALQGLGVAKARAGQHDEALAVTGEAIAEFRAIGDEEAVADASLDAAEALLDRAGASDIERANEAIERATPQASAATEGPLASRWRYLRGRTSLLRNDNRAAVKWLTEASELAERAGQWELRALSLSARAEAHRATGAELHARRDRERAIEVLESVASILPPDLRSAFWSVPSRVALRAQGVLESYVAPAMDGSVTISGITLGVSGHGMTVGSQDRRLVLLVDQARRVNEERTLDAVLEQTVRAAAELTNAERAMALLRDESGALVLRAQLGATDPVGGDVEPFSRSIAESALIDGEVLATHNATKDRRFSDFQSVHDRAIGAVAAVPIRARGRTLGVLYVENRQRRAQWGAMDVSILRAFSEQAGVAVERAQLIEQLQERTRELESARAEIEELLAARTVELEDTRRSLARAEEALRTRFAPQGMVASGDAMRKLFAIVERVRDADVPVVIEGESGTGKEMIARALHFSGARARGPFVVVHCGAIPETLLESELFGHVRGAFTGADRDRRGLIASANGGTLVLDEVSEMPLKMQVELLRVLQERKIRPVGAENEESVDARVVASSNKVLKDLVAQGLFREDLYYRLSVVTVRIPSLRQRADEIPALASHFLARFAEENAMPRKKLSREALAKLLRAPWPGNVRQLRHVLESAAVLVDGDVIEAEHLPLDESSERTSVAPPSTSPTALRKASERQRIVDALESCNWNKVKAASHLGMPRRTLYRRLKEYGLLDE